MSTRDLTAGRTREANTITAVLAAPCGLACAGTVIPGLDDAVTLVLLAAAALALEDLDRRSRCDRVKLGFMRQVRPPG